MIPGPVLVAVSTTNGNQPDISNYFQLFMSTVIPVPFNAYSIISGIEKGIFGFITNGRDGGTVEDVIY